VAASLRPELAQHWTNGRVGLVNEFLRDEGYDELAPWALEALEVATDADDFCDMLDQVVATA
jgi:hypothetical protein